MQQKTKAIRLKLDEPPSLNDLYKPVINRNTHQAYMILTPVGKRYKNYVYSVVAKEVRKEDEFSSKNDRLEVYIHFYPKKSAQGFRQHPEDSSGFASEGKCVC